MNGPIVPIALLPFSSSPGKETIVFALGNQLPRWPGEPLTSERLVQGRTKNGLWAGDRPRHDPEGAGPPALGFEELGGYRPG